MPLLLPPHRRRHRKRKLRFPSIRPCWKRKAIRRGILHWPCWRMTRNPWSKKWPLLQQIKLTTWTKFPNFWIQPMHSWLVTPIYAPVWPSKCSVRIVKRPAKPPHLSCPRIQWCPKKFCVLVIAQLRQVAVRVVTNVTLQKKNLCPVWSRLSIPFQGKWLF